MSLRTSTIDPWESRSATRVANFDAHEKDTLKVLSGSVQMKAPPTELDTRAIVPVANVRQE